MIDLGDGILAVEFHSKLNTIGNDTVQMLTGGVTEASERFAGLVVGNDAQNFCAGANLMMVLLEAQEDNWDEIDLMVDCNRAWRTPGDLRPYWPYEMVLEVAQHLD